MWITSVLTARCGNRGFRHRNTWWWRRRFRPATLHRAIALGPSVASIESDARRATILGLVGAGGIGLRLSERIQINARDQVAYIILLIQTSVAAIDATSRCPRLRLIGATER